MIMIISMPHFFGRPRIQKALRYTAAYLFFAIMALLGLVILESVRTNILSFCTLLRVDPQIIYIIYSWGSYLIYLPYVFLIAILEPYLNKAAKTGKVWVSVRKVLIIEGGIGLLSAIVMVIFKLVGMAPKL
jgi:hypothetical protein